MTGQAHCLFGDFFTHAANLEDNTTWLDYCHIMINGPLTTPHACLGRFGRGRLSREGADPHFTTTLHKAGERNTRRFDLTSLQPERLQSPQPKITEGERAATLCSAFPAAPMRLAGMLSWCGH